MKEVSNAHQTVFFLFTVWLKHYIVKHHYNFK